jgi:small subunit ribosomal protein S9
MATATKDALATGRRKTSVARVRVQEGKGQITINGRPLEQYFPSIKDRNAAIEPLTQTDKLSAVNVEIRVHGGGPAGQAGAVKMGLARAMRIFDGSLDELLRHSGLLTRDQRMKERKKYGLRGARRGTQFSKR